MRGLKRQHGIRARSVPPRQSVVSGDIPAPLHNNLTRVRVQQMFSDATEEIARSKKPLYSRSRSQSCTALDWFVGDMSWSDVEASGRLDRSGSYRSVQHEGPELDMRHACVKSSSPTVIHQTQHYSVAPLSAELMIPESAPSPTAGRSAPPPTPLTNVSYDATSRATVDVTVSWCSSILPVSVLIDYHSESMRSQTSQCEAVHNNHSSLSPSLKAHSALRRRYINRSGASHSLWIVGKSAITMRNTRLRSLTHTQTLYP